MSTVPPLPWMSVLRASSLAAVTILVWSTRLNFNSTQQARTCWRTPTTSDSPRMGNSSLRVTTICPHPSPRSGRVLEVADSFFDGQRRMDALERQTQLHERDGDRRLHPDDDRLGVEDARHG